MLRLSAGRTLCRRRGLLLGGILLAGLGGWSMAAAAPAALSGPIAKAVAAGRQSFIHDTFGGNGKTCSSCHTAAGQGPTMTPNGGHFPSLDAAATHFPRYNARAGKVITLQDQIRACVTGALGGKSPAPDSVTMTDLVSYLTSLSQGKPMDMGR